MQCSMELQEAQQQLDQQDQMIEDLKEEKNVQKVLQEAAQNGKYIPDTTSQRT